MIDGIQPSNIQPEPVDPVQQEVDWQLALAEQRRLYGDPILPEEPATEEVPATPVHKSSTLEEGEVDTTQDSD